MSLCDYSTLHQHLLAKRNRQCPVCERLLRTEDGLEQHLLAVHIGSASSRSKNFACTEPAGSRCADCNRSFPHAGALADHRGVAHSNPCPTCDMPDFMGHESIRAYKRSTGQSFCRDCDVRSSAATEFRCCDCDRDFIDEASLQRHLVTYTHALPLRFYPICRECDRQFRDGKALFRHLASMAHNPLGDIRCAASKRCKKRFSCPSALLHHLESGYCPSKMTRKKLNGAVLDMDTDRLISRGDALTEGEPEMPRSECSSPSSTRSILYTPDTSTSGTCTPGQPTPPSGLSGLESPGTIIHEISCLLCPKRKNFRSVSALQMHLASPAHSLKIFNCPLSLVPSISRAENPKEKIKYFSTLSGLTQHLESGACVGEITILREAVGYVERKLRDMGWKELGLMNF